MEDIAIYLKYLLQWTERNLEYAKYIFWSGFVFGAIADPIGVVRYILRRMRLLRLFRRFGGF